MLYLKSNKMTRILHISDTHGFHNEFPDDTFDDIDIVIHSGDCSNYFNVVRNEQEVINFMNWYERVPVKHKIYVAGNHDTSIERRKVKHIDIRDRGIIYLENDGVEIEGFKIWGSPITPTFGEWAFMKARDKTHDVWKQIPNDTDILVVHGPPKGVRDLSFNRDGKLEMCGDHALMRRCFDLKDTLKLVCFGHIHDMENVYNQGVSRFSKTITTFSNGACVHDGRFDRGLTSYGNELLIV